MCCIYHHSVFCFTKGDFHSCIWTQPRCMVLHSVCFVFKYLCFTLHGMYAQLYPMFARHVFRATFDVLHRFLPVTLLFKEDSVYSWHLTMTNNHYYSGLTTSADVLVCFSGLWDPLTLMLFVWPLILYYQIADFCKKRLTLAHTPQNWRHSSLKKEDKCFPMLFENTFVGLKRSCFKKCHSFFHVHTINVSGAQHLSKYLLLCSKK